jgi:hypothetical protein
MNIIGRKTVITESVVAKLTEAFRMGYNDEEACQYADIDRSTYYRHLQTDLDFATQIASAKNYVRLMCCSVLLEAIEHKNIQVCQWWLERRFREQFGRQVQVSSSDERERSRASFEEIRRKYTITKESSENAPIFDAAVVENETKQAIIPR